MLSAQINYKTENHEGKPIVFFGLGFVCVSLHTPESLEVKAQSQYVSSIMHVNTCMLV